MPKKIIIFEDGTTNITELSAFSSNKNDIIIYAFADNDGYYYLDEEQKKSADGYLLTLKIGLLAKKRLINDFLLQSFRSDVLKKIKNVTDTSIQKYLTKQVDCLFGDFSFSFEDIVAELDKYTIDVVMKMFEPVTDEAEENPEYIDFELIENYRIYVRKRSGEKEYNSYIESKSEDDSDIQEDSNYYINKTTVSSEMQNQERYTQTHNPKKEHPILKKIGKFAKNATIEILGKQMGFTNSQIEKIKDMNTMDAVTNMYDTALDNASKLPKSTNHTSSESLMEKAWKKRGIDYNKLQSLSDEQKGNYLRSVGINSRDEFRSIYNDVMREVANELKSRRQN